MVRHFAGAGLVLGKSRGPRASPLSLWWGKRNAEASVGAAFSQTSSVRVVDSVVRVCVAGDVCYKGSGFLDKNNDTLHSDFIDMMSVSTLPARLTPLCRPPLLSSQVQLSPTPTRPLPSFPLLSHSWSRRRSSARPHYPGCFFTLQVLSKLFQPQPGAKKGQAFNSVRRFAQSGLRPPARLARRALHASRRLGEQEAGRG